MGDAKSAPLGSFIGGDDGRPLSRGGGGGGGGGGWLPVSQDLLRLGNALFSSLVDQLSEVVEEFGVRGGQDGTGDSAGGVVGSKVSSGGHCRLGLRSGNSSLGRRQKL